MLKRKSPKEKGKLSFTRYFQEFRPGDRVGVVRELSVKFGFSNRLQGKTGIVIEKRGSAYYVKINDLNKPKYYAIKPIHLKRIENIK